MPSLILPVGAHDHGHGVPPYDASYRAFYFVVARVRALVPYGNGVHVRGVCGEAGPRGDLQRGARATTLSLQSGTQPQTLKKVLRTRSGSPDSEKHFNRKGEKISLLAQNYFGASFFSRITRKNSDEKYIAKSQRH